MGLFILKIYIYLEHVYSVQPNCRETSDETNRTLGECSELIGLNCIHVHVHSLYGLLTIHS